MKAQINACRWSADKDGMWVSFQTDKAKAICESLVPGKEYTIEVSRFYKKRSKNANDFLWEMCTQISEELAKDKVIVSKDDIYRKHIKEAGKCEFLAMLERAYEDFARAWGEKGTGWFCEKVDDCKIDGCVKVCCYYGSSTYNTAEMTRLLDSVVQEAKDIGIEVISESELALLKEGWVGK